MANQYGPRIITDGLTLALDVSDKNSYNGSGTVWNDLSQGLVFNSQGTQTPLTTIGGVTCFDFNGSGYWECGTNFGLVDLGGDCTIVMWFFCQTITLRKTIFEKAGTSYASYQQEIAVTWEDYSQFTYYSRLTPNYDYGGTSTFINNTWNMIAIKMSTGKTTAARTGFYSLNGAAWTANYTSRSNTALVAAGAIRIGTGYAGTVTDGYISSVYCYNRMLSDSEIAINYNVMKSKFRL